MIREHTSKAPLEGQICPNTLIEPHNNTTEPKSSMKSFYEYRQMQTFILTLLFVSFSVNHNSGSVPAWLTSHANVNFSRVWWLHSTEFIVERTIFGFIVHPSCLQPQIHVLRYQSVGNTWTVDVSGPLFVTVILHRISFGPAFAYSAVTSKYLLSSKTPAKKIYRLLEDYGQWRKAQACKKPYPYLGTYCKGSLDSV